MVIKGDGKAKVVVTILNIPISVLTMTLVLAYRGGLKVAGRASLAVFLAALVPWITELFPPVGAPMTDYGIEILNDAVTSNHSMFGNSLTTARDGGY